MRIAFISPHSVYYSRDPEFSEFWNSSKYNELFRNCWSGLGTGLLVLAGLTPPGNDLELIDENIEEIDFSRQFDLVCVSATTQQATRAYAIAEQFRKRGITTVIGGIHPTVLPLEAKSHFDSVVLGEGETTWLQLLHDYQSGTLKPFYKSEDLFDLKDSPVPRYDLLKKCNPKIAWLQTTRGCPHDCEFCVASKIFGSTYRLKSIDQIVHEIKEIRKQLGDVFIGFADDNIAVDKSFLSRLLKEIAPLHIRWFGQSDISIANDETLLKMLFVSGCNFLLVGLESLSNKNLREINTNLWKLSRSREYPSLIEKIQSAGIGVMGSFIFGFDHDDQSVFDTTTDFAIAHNLCLCNFSILTPYPGSRIRDRLAMDGRLLPTEWDNYTLWDVNFIPKNMSPEQLQNGLFMAYRKILDGEVCINKAKYFKNLYKRLMEPA
jgi:radical SAM superfamily enzyme YgiQ (UPF0313 family)